MPCERPSRFWFIESLFPTSRKEREKWGTRILDTRLVKGFTLSRRTQKRWGTLWAIIFCEFGDGRKRESRTQLYVDHPKNKAITPNVSMNPCARMHTHRLRPLST
jgi:hypothetical protein